MRCAKNLILLICFFSNCFLFGVSEYSIYRFDENLFEKQHDIKVTSFTTNHINNRGQVVGTFQFHKKTETISKLEIGVYFWDPDTGFKVIMIDNMYKRSPVINDLGIVAWTTYQSTTGYSNTSSSYIWDSENDQLQSLMINGGYINAINNNNEILTAKGHIFSITREGILNNSPIKSSKELEIAEFYRNLYGIFSNKQSKQKQLNIITIDCSSINNSSKVVGSISFYIADYVVSRGFIWSSNGIKDLGQGYHPQNINDNDQVVGTFIVYNTSKLKLDSHAFLWQNNIVTIIQQNSRAFAINNHGDVVGDLGNFNRKMFFYTEGIFQEISNGIGLDINDATQIVGG